ncbi:MAG: effector binding domain-containing protein [Parachlamydiales bacterium]|nr:effector binding domain-containing protein [Parachlamydiales bacterium]
MADFEIVKKNKMTIVGIECRTSNDPNACPVDIPKLRDRFTKENIFQKIPNKISHDIFGLYCEYEKDHTKPFTYLIGCPVNSTDGISPELTIKMIPEARYALFKAIGEHPKTLIETWMKVWQLQLKRSFTYDFEIYGSPFKNNPPQVDLYIAIHQ